MSDIKKETQEKVSAAKASIENSKKLIAKDKADIKAQKANIKSQKAAIKAAKANAKHKKAEQKAATEEKKAGEKAAAAKSEPEPAKKPVAAKAATSNAYFVIKDAANESHVFNLFSKDGKLLATSQVYKTLDSCNNGIMSVQNNAPIAALEDQTVKNFEPQPSPKFELYLDNSGEAYRYRLKAKNGQNIVASLPYDTREACLAGIEEIREAAKTRTIKEEN